jgi:hypothetical protein
MATMTTISSSRPSSPIPVRSIEPFGPSRFDGREKPNGVSVPARTRRRDTSGPADAPGCGAELASWRHDPLAHRTLRVVRVRDDDADQPPALVVEDTAGPATSDRVA